MLSDDRELVTIYAQALGRSRPEHVVLLSSVGVPNLTVVRAAYFMENLGASLAGTSEGTFSTFLSVEQKLAMVATRDIGATAAAALLAGPKGKTRIELEGPERYSMRDVAAELSALLGRPIAVQHGPASAIVPTFESLGLSRRTAELYHEMFAGIDSGHVAFEGAGARHVRGVTSLREVLTQLLAPRAAA